MLRLTYFDARGRVDPIRMLLELTGTPYEFEPVAFTDWPKVKPRMLELTPFGQLPVLEDGELVLSQAQAILRYLSGKLGLGGSTPVERLRADELGEIAADILLHFGLLIWSPDFAAKRESQREAMKKRLLGLEAHFVRRRADETHWVTEGVLTHGDLAVAYSLECLLPLYPDLVSETRELDRFMRAVFAEPAIRAYVHSSRRPKTYTSPMAQFAGKPGETHQWERLTADPIPLTCFAG